MSTRLARWPRRDLLPVRRGAASGQLIGISRRIPTAPRAHKHTHTQVVATKTWRVAGCRLEMAAAQWPIKSRNRCRGVKLVRSIWLSLAGSASQRRQTSSRRTRWLIVARASWTRTESWTKVANRSTSTRGQWPQPVVSRLVNCAIASHRPLGQLDPLRAGLQPADLDDASDARRAASGRVVVEAEAGGMRPSVCGPLFLRRRTRLRVAVR